MAEMINCFGKSRWKSSSFLWVSLMCWKRNLCTLATLIDEFTRTGSLHCDDASRSFGYEASWEVFWSYIVFWCIAATVSSELTMTRDEHLHEVIELQDEACIDDSGSHSRLQTFVDRCSEYGRVVFWRKESYASTSLLDPNLPYDIKDSSSSW